MVLAIDRKQIQDEISEMDPKSTKTGSGVLQKNISGAVQYRCNARRKRYIEEMYIMHRTKLLRSLNKFNLNPDEGEEIVQDAFIRLIELNHVESLEFPYAYLYRIAMNLVKDRAKALRIRQAYIKYQLAWDRVDTISPERQHLADEELNIAFKAIDNLPPKCRSVFLSHRLDGLRHKEISQDMGLSRYAIEKHIMRATARCTEYRQQFCFQD